MQLWLLKQKARPQGYVKKDDLPACYAARTMLWSGPIIAAVRDLPRAASYGGSGAAPTRDLANQRDVRNNVITGFQNPAIAGFYIVAMTLLCMHLYHGLWSLFQSLG